jgi:hypothetical protein
MDFFFKIFFFYYAKLETFNGKKKLKYLIKTKKQ